MKDLPTNNDYQGPGKSVGTSLAHILGPNVEGFFGGLVNGKTSSYRGLYVGGILGEGFTFYGTASYTFLEPLRVSQSGYIPLNYIADPITALRELGDMLTNDIFHFGY